jgi:hypothetical protein
VGGAFRITDVNKNPNPGLEGAYSITAAKTIPESAGSCRLVENRVAAV